MTTQGDAIRNEANAYTMRELIAQLADLAYQYLSATGATPSNGSVTQKKISDITTNVFDYTKSVSGKLSRTNGITSIVANSNYETSDWIPVEKGDTLYFDDGGLIYEVVNSDKTTTIAFADNGGDWNTKSINVTWDNSAFIRFSYGINVLNPQNKMVILNNYIPSSYIPYGKSIVNWLKVINDMLMDKSITASKIADKTITEDEIKNGAVSSSLIKDTFTNLFDYTVCVSGKLSRSSRVTTISANSNYVTSDYIPVTKGDVINVTSAGLVYEVVDSAKTTTIAFADISGDWNTKSIPITWDNSAYIRVTIPVNTTPKEQHMVTKNHAVPINYLANGKYLIDWLKVSIDMLLDKMILGSKIADKTLTGDKLLNAYTNMFDYTACVVGKMIRTGGVTSISVDANWVTSPFFPVKNGDVINSLADGFVYEITNLSGNNLVFGTLAWRTKTYTVSNVDAAYMRVSLPVNNVPKEQQMVFVNHTVPSYYIGNGKYLIEWINTGLDTDKVNKLTSAAFDEIKDRLLLPPTMYFIDNLPLPIYKDSIFSTVDDLNLFDAYMINVKSDNTPEYRSFLHDYVLDGTKLNNQFKVAISQKVNFNYDYFSTINKSMVTSTANNGKTKKYNGWGDSLTQNGVLALVRDKLATYGVTATLIGTTTFNNGYTGVGEGRSGWSYRNFIGMGYKYPNGTDTIPYSQMTFLRLANDTDKTNHPTWCFRRTGALKEKSYQEDTDKTGDFYIFDYATYLANNSLETPDIITIGLSRNDLLNYPDSENLAGCKLGLEIMIKQIKAACPNAKIGIIPTTVWQNHSDYNSKWVGQVSNWIENCLTDIKTYQQTYSGIYIIPSWCHMNRRFSWDYASQVDLNSTNQSQKALLGDHLHYGALGRMEDANVITSWIMNVI